MRWALFTLRRFRAQPRRRAFRAIGPPAAEHEHPVVVSRSRGRYASRVSHRALVLVLLGLAVAFRLWAVPSARFTGDESDYWYRSRQVATGAERPAYGPEITGSAARLPGPAYYYLMAVPQALGASPVFGSAFVALLHGLTALLLYRVIRSVRGPPAGAIAAALVAFAPWDVLYGDRIWGSCVVPVWGSLTLYACVRCRERPAWLGAAVFFALVLPQLHLSVPVLWAAGATIVALRPPARWPWRAIGVGLALSVVAYLPPLLAELSSGFANTKSILAHSSGKTPWAEAIWAPAKVFGYAVLYGSSEIGYHWARGYWGGGFSEAQAYFTSEGLGRWWGRHGVVMGSAHVVSVALALLGWTVELVRAGRATVGAAKRRALRALELDTIFTLAVVVGLGVGAILIVAARKTYFPHYANILMPMMLAPIVFGLDRVRPRNLMVAGLGISMIAMLVGTVQYYLRVDSLNGLAPTLAMVKRVLDDPAPAAVRFTHFHNLYAWQRVAQGVHAESLPSGSSVTYTVHNARPHRGDVPPGGSLHGPVLLSRRPPAGQPLPPRPRVAYEQIRVEAEHPDGQRRSCSARSGPCAYGPKPWQKLEPTSMKVGGRPRPLVFMHPVQGGVVRARIPVPAGVKTATLEFALSDDATRSRNRSPVNVAVVDEAGQTLAKGQADNRPGLKRLALTLTSTDWVALEIRTDNDGARVFGFDVRWGPR